MRAQLAALKTLLDALGPTTYVGTVAPEILPPYFVIAPRAPSDAEDGSIGDRRVGFQIDVLVTAVAGTTDGALDLRGRAYTVLAPSGGPLFPAVTGWATQVDWLRFEGDGTDTSVKIPATNRNPAYALDTYTLNSQPV